MSDDTTGGVTPPPPPAADAPPPPAPPIEPIAPTPPGPPASPPPAPPAAPPPVYSQVAPPAPAKRKVWPWVLGGSLLAAFVLIAVVIVVIVSSILPKPGPPPEAFTEPQDAVIAFDRAYETQDCDLFIAATTSGFRRTYLGEGFSCDVWLANAESLVVDGAYAYTVTVNDTTIDGSDAMVETTEVSGLEAESVTYLYRYGLHLTNGSWLIYRIEDITPE